MSYDVSQDYTIEDGVATSSPSWCVAVFRLGQPLSYSRVDKKGYGSVIGGALLRKEEPLIITSECVQLSISSAKKSYTKTLHATLKGRTNFLSANAILPGDWLMAWMHTNPLDTDRIVKALKNGQPTNDFHSGLKFVGRVSAIGRNRVVNVSGLKTVSYTLQGTGFTELSTPFFYDVALATVESKEDIWQFFSQIGLEGFKWLAEGKTNAGNFKDNGEEFFEKFLDLVVGKGIATKIGAAREIVAKDVTGGSIKQNKFTEGEIEDNLLQSPQQNKEAPYAYLIPISVATALGRTTVDDNKGSKHGHRVFGYADVLTTLTGVQRYSQDNKSPHQGFVPLVEDGTDARSSRLRCKGPDFRIKGTYIPIEPTFLNKSLWQLLSEFKNPVINEMYTCLRSDLSGNIMPTIVFRQIPFSTDAAIEDPNMPLTRFLSLPRWIIPTYLVHSDNLGRNDATRFNFIHVYGQVSPYHQEEQWSIQAQMARNHPIFDGIDTARSGIRPYMSAVACSTGDLERPNGARTWMEAVADWTMGSQFTLNGTINCAGIQSPIAEGDNIEFDSIAFQVESVAHNCSMTADGIKTFSTTLTLTNGMPIDQKGASVNFPRYPGFSAGQTNQGAGDTTTEQEGDDQFAVSKNPGFVLDM
jgi:hypothetical protein